MVTGYWLIFNCGSLSIGGVTSIGGGKVDAFLTPMGGYNGEIKHDKRSLDTYG